MKPQEHKTYWTDRLIKARKRWLKWAGNRKDRQGRMNTALSQIDRLAAAKGIDPDLLRQ